jgi:hypothetical protein
MLRVGFKPTIPVFEWAKMVHALDRAAIVIGIIIISIIITTITIITTNKIR